jgi:hypothetical protein
MANSTQSSNLTMTVDPFLIRKRPSIFTNRNGKLDIVIDKQTDGSWDALYNGKRYTIAMILDAETYQPIRSNYLVPQALLDNLVAWGF